MWGGVIGLIIQLVSGAAGGNIAGSVLKQYDLGVVGNSIVGLIGGGVGAQVLGALLGTGAGGAAAAGGLDIGAIVEQIAAGGAGGGILMVIVGIVKQAMGGQKAA
jgi:hypothetical protein